MQDIRLAVLALTLACASHSLLAAPASSATSTITGLTFKLVDLDPTDGIAPSMEIDPYWSFANLEIYEADGSLVWENVPGSVFANTSGSAVSSDGSLTASKNKNGLSSSVNLSSGQLNALADPSRLGTPDHSSHLLGRVSANADVYSWPLQWTLSPRTQLVITGTASVNTSTDASGLASSSMVSGITGQEWTLTAETMSFVSAVLDHTYVDWGITVGGGFLGSDSFTLSASSTQSVDQAGVHTVNPAVLSSNQGSFNLHFDNTTTDIVQGSLAIKALTATWLSAKAYPAVDAPVGNIPEPGTFALMGLGLGLLALLGARTRG